MTTDPLAPPDRPERTSQELKLAWANLDRALVHVPDAQICGIWPDGSSVRGEHIKFLITQLREVAVPARAHQENFFAMAARHEQENDDLARSGTPEIRDRQPAAVTDAGHQDDCAGTKTAQRMPPCSACGHSWAAHVIPGGIDNIDIYPHERRCADCQCRNYEPCAPAIEHAFTPDPTGTACGICGGWPDDAEHMGTHTK